jgi:hypothetical protein
VMTCVPDQVQSDVFTAPVAISSGRRVHLKVEVDYEMRASFQTKPRRRASRTSLAPLSGWRVRISQDRQCPQTSTTLTIKSAGFAHVSKGRTHESDQAGIRIDRPRRRRLRVSGAGPGAGCGSNASACTGK